jgi:hypothetical protein
LFFGLWHGGILYLVVMEKLGRKDDIALEVIRRIGGLLIWLIFVQVHAVLLLLLLFLLWLFQVGPAEMVLWWRDLYRNNSFATLAAWLGPIGISLILVVSLYVKAWRKFFATWMSSFLWRDLL